jgi:hypothetical protein
MGGGRESPRVEVKIVERRKPLDTPGIELESCIILLANIPKLLKYIALRNE